MSPSSTSEARKRRDAKATPEPVTLPESFVFTTLERVKRVRNGQVAEVVADDFADIYWWDWNAPEWSDNEIVLWRPSPPRKVTVELDEDVVKRLANAAPDVGDHRIIHEACLAALDGDQ
jgi:hypothetical protein